MRTVRLTLVTNEPIDIDPAQVVSVMPCVPADVAGTWLDGVATVLTLRDGTRLPLAEPAAQVQAKLARAESGR